MLLLHTVTRIPTCILTSHYHLLVEAVAQVYYLGLYLHFYFISRLQAYICVYARRKSCGERAIKTTATCSSAWAIHDHYTLTPPTNNSCMQHKVQAYYSCELGSIHKGTHLRTQALQLP